MKLVRSGDYRDFPFATQGQRFRYYGTEPSVWSATPAPNSGPIPGLAYVVFFSNGFIGTDDVNTAYYVRCVK